MMHVQFSDIIKEKSQGLSLTLIEANKIKVQPSTEFFNSEFKALEKELRQKFKNTTPSENEIISATRKMYRSAGWEPTKYRPSSEALVRRILQGKGLYKINNIVDFANLVSAKYHIPLGLYDLNKIKGNIYFDIGKPDETYQGLSKPVIRAEGKLILRDDIGVFGNPTADSMRTSIQNETESVLTIFFVGAGISKKNYIAEMTNKLIEYYSSITNPENIISFNC